jgi:hypothetical protein
MEVRCRLSCQSIRALLINSHRWLFIVDAIITVPIALV